MPPEFRSDAVDPQAPVPDATGEEAPLSDIRLRRRERDRLAEMVVADADHAESQRNSWLTKRRENAKRFELLRERKNWPWKDASNVKLPILPTAVYATAAHMMASIFGVSQLTGVDAVGEDDTPKVPNVEQFVEWMVTDRRIGFYHAIDQAAEGSAKLGDYCAHIFWDRQTRRIKERVSYYADPDEPSTPLLEPGTDEKIPVGDVTRLLAALGEKVGLEMAVDLIERGGPPPTVDVIEDREVVVFEGSRVDIFDTEDLLLPPDAKGIQYPDSDWVARRVWFSMDQIARKYKSGAFNVMSAQDLKEMRAWEAEEGGGRNQQMKTEQAQAQGIVFGPGRNKREFINWVGRKDIDGDGLDEEVVLTVHRGMKKLVRVILIDDIAPHGKRPYVLIPYLLRLGSPYGKGVMDVGENLEAAMNSLMNQFIDRATLINSLTGFYRGDGLEDQHLVIEIGQLIPIGMMGEVIFPNLPEYGNVFAAILGILERHLQNLIGVNDMTLGRLQQSSRATATEISSAMGEASLGFELKNRRFQDAVAEIVTQMFQLYQAFMPEGFEIKVNPKLAGGQQQASNPFRKMSREDIRGQFDFRFMGDPVSGNRTLRQQRALLMAQVVIPVLAQFDPGGVVMLIRDLLNEFGKKDTDKILPPETVESLRRQSAAAEQMQALQAELAQFDAKLEQAKTQSEIALTQANIQDIIARIQLRVAEIRKIGAEAAKMMKEGEFSDVRAFAEMSKVAGANGNAAAGE